MEQPEHPLAWKRNLIRLIYEGKAKEASALLQEARQSGLMEEYTASIYEDVISRLGDWERARSGRLPNPNAEGMK